VGKKGGEAEIASGTILGPVETDIVTCTVGSGVTKIRGSLNSEFMTPNFAIFH